MPLRKLFSTNSSRNWGKFPSPDGSAPLLCVCTGTGFAPVKSLLDDLVKRKSTRPVTLVWGAREAASLYLPSALAVRRQDGSVTARSERHQETFDAGMRSFINEARLLAQFDHPSLLKVYRFWQDKGTTYMVMPFYKGQTLKEALAGMGERPSEAWLLGVLDSVTQALSVMHGAQCYHRDIAPDNILLLEDSGLPVVLDFGAARRVISDMTQAITVILKPGYAPVEQYAETPDMKQGPWTDVYALGAVLHFAVMGKTPVPSVGRMMKDGYQPLAGRTPPLAGYSERFLQAIDQALRVHPDDQAYVKRLATAPKPGTLLRPVDFEYRVILPSRGLRPRRRWSLQPFSGTLRSRKPWIACWARPARSSSSPMAPRRCCICPWTSWARAGRRQPKCCPARVR